MSTDGSNIVEMAQRHVGEEYVLGTLVPKDHPDWEGPWDCAEFVSWLIYQVGGLLYGCNRDDGNPATADAYTGYWAKDAKSKGKTISVEEAARTPGAAVLRRPTIGKSGHIVISDGQGGTIEAHSTKEGVIRSTLSNRRWDIAILVPGLQYQEGPSIEIEPPATLIYRSVRKPMTGPTVKRIQRALKKKGFSPGPINGRYGPWTAAAVLGFQASHGMLTDGEVGPVTAKGLEIKLPATTRERGSRVKNKRSRKKSSSTLNRRGNKR